MPTRTINEGTNSRQVVTSDGTLAGTATHFVLIDTDGTLAPPVPCDQTAAIATAAAAAGITVAQQRSALVEYFKACRAQARTAQNWTGP